MRAPLRNALTAAVVTAATGFLAAPAPVHAQEQEDEGPAPRYVTATVFDVPLDAREKVFPYMQEYVLPGMQLNPNVVNFRLLIHNWGSDASEVVFLTEYASFDDINAPCGTPCDEYFEEHPQPEEGDPGYEEFQEVQAMYLKYFSGHHDEIFMAPMDLAVVDGEVQGTVGPPEEDEGMDG